MPNIKPELNIHVPVPVLDALRDADVQRLRTVVTSIRRHIVAPFTVATYGGPVHLLDDALRAILNVVKDMYQRNGWLEDGFADELPVRHGTLHLLRCWRSDIASSYASEHPNMCSRSMAVDPALEVLIDRLGDTCRLLDEYANPTLPIAQKRSLRLQLTARRVM